MRNLLTILGALAILASCRNAGDGELTGSLGRGIFYPETPLGTVVIPEGSYNMGATDQDVPWAGNNRTKTVSISAFYMDDTEITNNEYRQFVDYVRDSIIRVYAWENGYIEPENFFLTTNQYGQDYVDDIGKDQYPIDWDVDFNFMDERDLEDEDARLDIQETFYLTGAENYYSRMEVDPRKLMFKYWWIDFKAAARKSTSDPQSRNNESRDMNLGKINRKGQSNFVSGHKDKSRFIIDETINVYPDTLVWVHDFTYSFQEHRTNNYFWHPAYDDYPLVGVTWKQSIAFSYWRTQWKNDFLRRYGQFLVDRFRIPTESEWEFAARGGLDLSNYPWGGPYIRNAQGCFLANFKPMRGRYKEDGGLYTVKADSYHPNGYGLFNMAGNVAEWTSTAFDESVYDFSHDIDSDYDYQATDKEPNTMKRKVIRGGSWKDFGYYLQCGVRTYEYEDTAKSYIGFRTVQTYLGRPNGEL